MVKLMDKTIDNDKKVPDASRTGDFKILILIYEVQSVLEHGCCKFDLCHLYFLSASMRASRCSTATSCGMFFSTQTCLR